MGDIKMIEIMNKKLEEPDPAEWSIAKVKEDEKKVVPKPQPLPTKVLVTGGYGFAATYLAKLMLDKGVKEVHMIVRRNSDDFRHKRLKIKEHPNLHLHYGDVTDGVSIRELIMKIKPDLIYNLAAIMYVQDSWHTPIVTFDTNTYGVLHILLSLIDLKKINHRVRFIQAGTSEQYGEVHSVEVPITEYNRFRPKSPYGISKVAAEHLCKIYAREYDLDVIVTRAFNHVGITQNPQLVIPAFARRVWRAHQNGTPIKHGNLDAIRDFTDITDIVRAYWMLGVLPNEYTSDGEAVNICSGRENSISMGEILNIMIDYVKSNFNEDFKPTLDPAYYRPNDVELLVGDNELMHNLTGWKPEKSLDNIIVDMMMEAIDIYE